MVLPIGHHGLRKDNIAATTNTPQTPPPKNFFTWKKRHAYEKNQKKGGVGGGFRLDFLSQSIVFCLMDREREREREKKGGMRCHDEDYQLIGGRGKDRRFLDGPLCIPPSGPVRSAYGVFPRFQFGFTPDSPSYRRLAYANGHLTWTLFFYTFFPFSFCAQNYFFYVCNKKKGPRFLFGN